MAKSISIEDLKKFVRSQHQNYLKKGNVTSIGVGYKVTKGKRSKELSIQFTVGRKAAPESLEAMGTEMLPKSIKIAGVDVPTDVLERSYGLASKAVKLEDAPGRKVVADPIVPGISIGHPTITAGTVGCVVYDAGSGAPYVLSNWHVLNGGQGRIGDSIVQPGKHDDNRVNRNKVGHLVRSHLGVAGDCAIASIESRGLSAQVFDLGVTVDSIGEAELGDKVVKSGRTTDVTYGIVTRVHTVARINYDEAGDQDIGCFEIEPDPDKPAPNGEISMGGDSGSCWLERKNGKVTGMMLGLHFAGETGDAPEHALACYPASVFEKLQIRPTKPTEAVHEDESGLGFDTTFVGEEVWLPRPSSGRIQEDLVEVNGRTVIDYMHFSLAMSKGRKFARWVAWNIDGTSTKRLSRNGIPFIKDPDVPSEYQVGNELYVNNDLDRGHIARRQDLLWGSMEDARRANVDSFFYTNMTPQHKAFNQSASGGIWGSLENAIYEDLEVHDLRLSLFGGPILRDDDREYRGVKVPKDFWKVIYFREAEDGPLRVKAYMLTQRDLLNDLEALELPEFQVYEVSLQDLSGHINLQLPGGTAPESCARRRRRRTQTEALEGPAKPRVVKSVAEIV
jgi:endonuclease G